KPEASPAVFVSSIRLAMALLVQLIPNVHLSMFTRGLPARRTGGAVNHSSVLLGFMLLNPPSPLLTDNHVPLPALAPLVAGEPLSCVPPRTTVSSAGCCDMEMNCSIEPANVAFRLWNHGVPGGLEHTPVFVAKLSRVRNTPPSLPK